MTPTIDEIYKPNSYTRRLVEHHTKYLETHGVDETMWITISEHNKINHRLLFPMVSAEELAKISLAAHKRTEKYSDYHKNPDRYLVTLPSMDELRAVVKGKAIL